MKMEHSQSQNQQPETTLSTSDKRYQNSLANAVHASQQAFGLEKYGILLSEVPLDRYDWQLMALEESVDMNQYLTQEVRRLRGAVLHWTEKATNLAEENEALKDLLSESNRYGTKLLESFDKTNNQLRKVTKELIEQVKLTETYVRMLPNGLNYGIVDPNEGVVSVQKEKEMMEDGISD